MQKISKLHSFIEQLPDTIIAQIQQLSQKRIYEDGEKIYRQGDQSTDIYWIISGEVRISNYFLDGKEVIINHFKKGDCFGETGVIDGLLRNNSTTSIGQSQLYILSKTNFKKLYNEQPLIAQTLNRVMALRIRILCSFITDSNALTLRQRLARTILRLAYSYSEQEKNIQIKISQEDLGRNLGASRQSISKELNNLCKEGVITLHYGKIMITDITLLSSIYELQISDEQLTPIY